MDSDVYNLHIEWNRFELGCLMRDRIFDSKKLAVVYIFSLSQLQKTKILFIVEILIILLTCEVEMRTDLFEILIYFVQVVGLSANQRNYLLTLIRTSVAL